MLASRYALTSFTSSEILEAIIIFVIISIRAIFIDSLEIASYLILWVYLSLNSVINLLDFIVNRHLLGYYDDSSFTNMVSFQIFSILSCGVISFVFA
jgi:hypothetical protein